MAYDQHQQSARSVVARCAVVTLSDTRSIETDTSGKLICDLLRSANHEIVSYQIQPDDAARIAATLQTLLDAPAIDAILTNGGTGISRRDQTIDIIAGAIDRPLPGFGELFRMLSYQQIGSGAMLSRAIGGIASDKLLFAMPGSTKAVDLAMRQLILPELNHLIFELRK